MGRGVRSVARQKFLDPDTASEVMIAMVLAASIRIMNDVDAFHVPGIGTDRGVS